jgi:hypothetical protein
MARAADGCLSSRMRSLDRPALGYPPPRQKLRKVFQAETLCLDFGGVFGVWSGLANSSAEVPGVGVMSSAGILGGDGGGCCSRNNFSIDIRFFRPVDSPAGPNNHPSGRTSWHYAMDHAIEGLQESCDAS